MNHKDFAKLDIDNMSREEVVSFVKTLIAHIAMLEEKVEALERAKNNNSKNSSMPPSTDQKPEAPVQSENPPDEHENAGKSANTYNQRHSTRRQPGGQKGRKGKTLTKDQAEELLKEKDVIHRVINVGKDTGGRCIKRYVVDLKVVPVVKEYRFYPNEDGKVVIPRLQFSLSILCKIYKIPLLLSLC